jgi:uncharacterized protein (TIGR02246 family)
MLRRLSLAVCLLLATLRAQPPAALSALDEKAIRAVVASYLAARTKQDAAALEKLFTNDVDQLVSSGEWRKGRDAVVRGTLQSSQSSGGQRSILIESVRLVAPGVALADGRYELKNLTGGQTRRMWTTFLLSSAPDGWRIAAIRNMLPAAPVPVQPPAR